VCRRSRQRGDVWELAVLEYTDVYGSEQPPTGSSLVSGYTILFTQISRISVRLLALICFYLVCNLLNSTLSRIPVCQLGVFLTFFYLSIITPLISGHAEGTTSATSALVTARSSHHML